jgi:hypothetical protein
MTDKKWDKLFAIGLILGFSLSFMITWGLAFILYHTGVTYNNVNYPGFTIGLVASGINVVIGYLMWKKYKASSIGLLVGLLLCLALLPVTFNYFRRPFNPGFRTSRDWDVSDQFTTDSIKNRPKLGTTVEYYNANNGN